MSQLHIEQTKIMWSRTACLGLAAALAAPGCAEPIARMDDGRMDDGEPAAETTSELAAPGCQTAVNDADLSAVPWCSVSSSTSSSSAYGTEDCPDRWLVGLGDFTAGDVVGTIEWVDPQPSTALACSRSYLTLDGYVK